MSNFIMKQVSTDVYEIRLARAVVGRIWKNFKDGNFNGRLDTSKKKNILSSATSAEDVFYDLVRQSNRIAICGENDARKAAQALAERNAKVQEDAMKAANAWNMVVAGTPFENQFRMEPRVKSSKIVI